MSPLLCPAAAFPRLRLVIDHLAKPLLRLGSAGLAGWREDMAAAAGHPNVWCKISGLVTEVDPDNHRTPWTDDTFRPFVHHVLDVFGPDRRANISKDKFKNILAFAFKPLPLCLCH